jgi:hypothetical protein
MISTLRGDVNGDGQSYKSDDVTLLGSIYKKIQSGQDLQTIKINDLIRGDLNRDGRVTAEDVIEASHVWMNGEFEDSFPVYINAIWNSNSGQATILDKISTVNSNVVSTQGMVQEVQQKVADIPPMISAAAETVTSNVTAKVDGLLQSSNVELHAKIVTSLEALSNALGMYITSNVDRLLQNAVNPINEKLTRLSQEANAKLVSITSQLTTGFKSITNYLIQILKKLSGPVLVTKQIKI